MDAEARLQELVECAQCAGLNVRHAPREPDAGGSPGGAVARVRGRTIVFLNPAASHDEQAAVVVEALRGCEELRDRYLPPRLREWMEGDTD